MEERINAGYKIIKAIEIEDVEIVLGEDKSKQLSPYVTWICNQGRYNLGHYFENYRSALSDFYYRVFKECKLAINKG